MALKDTGVKKTRTKEKKSSERNIKWITIIDGDNEPYPTHELKRQEIKSFKCNIKCFTKIDGNFEPFATHKRKRQEKRDLE